MPWQAHELLPPRVLNTPKLWPRGIGSLLVGSGKRFRVVGASRRSFFAAGMFLVGNLASGQLGRLPSLEADQSSFDAERGVLVATGNVEVALESLILQADEVQVDARMTTIMATGNVRLTRGAFRVVAPLATYNYVNGSFSAEQVRMGAYPYFLEAARLSGTPEDLLLEDAVVYFNTPSASSLRIEVSSLRLKGQTLLALEEPLFKLGVVPLAKLDRLEQPVDEPLPFSYRGGVGFQGDFGAFWQNNLLVRVHRDWKVGGNLDGYSSRGVLVGPTVEGRVGADGVGLAGDLRLDTGWLRDLGSSEQRGSDLRGLPIGASRYFAQGEFRGGDEENLDVNGALRAWSDGQVLRDFRRWQYVAEPYPTSFLQVTQRGTNWLGSGLLEGSLVDDVLATQRTPAFQFNWLPTPVGDTGWTFEGMLAAVRLRENPLEPSLVALGASARDTAATPDLAADRVEVFLGARRPLSVEPWLRVVPRVGLLLSGYDVSEPTSERVGRAVGEIGFDAEAVFTGVWNAQNALWEIDGLRHQLRPHVGYRWLPGADSASGSIPPIDRPAALSSSPQTLDLARRQDRDALGQEHTFRLGLEQALATRRRDYGSRTLASLNLVQDFHPNPAGPRPRRLLNRDFPADQTVGDLFGQGTLEPLPWLAIEVAGRWGWEHLGLNQIAQGLRLRDADQWSLQVAHLFVGDVPLQRDLHQWVIAGDYRVNLRNAFRTEWRIDADSGILSQQTYAWATRLDATWDVEIALTARDNAQREGSLSVNLQARLLSF